MIFSFTLTISHPDLEKPISHVDMIKARSRCAVLKYLNLTGRQICELKNKGVTEWRDEKGASHKLELNQEAN